MVRFRLSALLITLLRCNKLVCVLGRMLTVAASAVRRRSNRSLIARKMKKNVLLAGSILLCRLVFRLLTNRLARIMKLRLTVLIMKSKRVRPMRSDRAPVVAVSVNASLTSRLVRARKTFSCRPLNTVVILRLTVSLAISAIRLTLLTLSNRLSEWVPTFC